MMLSPFLIIAIIIILIIITITLTITITVIIIKTPLIAEMSVAKFAIASLEPARSAYLHIAAG